MEIRTVRPHEVEEFLGFLDGGMRPGSAPTRAWEDFPVILSAENAEGLCGVQDARGWAAGLAVLVRTFTTTGTPVQVAGIGSVVTRADRRGEGLSRRLQETVLGRLAGAGVPLAVLWTDQPEIYAGRGFRPAGWEYHADLAAADLAGLQPADVEIRPYTAVDALSVGMLYGRHALRTEREPGDDARLYGMPGTRGLVAARAGDVIAYAFFGKGEDFPAYAAEWGGPPDLALAVMAAARERGLGTRVLVPAGGEALLQLAVPRGASVSLAPSGMWSVLRTDRLLAVAGPAPAGDVHDPRTWLGEPAPTGTPDPGRFAVAVWGFDSV